MHIDVVGYGVQSRVYGVIGVLRTLYYLDFCTPRTYALSTPPPAQLSPGSPLHNNISSILKPIPLPLTPLSYLLQPNLLFPSHPFDLSLRTNRLG